MGTLKKAWVFLVVWVCVSVFLFSSASSATSLHNAVIKGDLAEVERLIEQGADVNARSIEGYTPLYLAARGGHRNVAELLIAKGADVNARSIEGYTPFLFAYMGGIKIWQDLFANINDINTRDRIVDVLFRCQAEDEGFPQG